MVEEAINRMRKKNILNQVISILGKEPKIYHHNDGKRIYIKMKIDKKWKQVFAYSEEELYKKIIDIGDNTNTITLKSIYPEFMKYRRDMKKVSPKTIQENANDWNKHLINNSIILKPLNEITTRDFIIYFEEITKERTLTAKAVSNLKSLINKIYAYAIREGYIEKNPVKEIDFSDFNYYIPDRKNPVYTKENRQKLLEYLYDIEEPYALAIQLDFQLTCRIGEIKALKWENVDMENRKVYINSQALIERTMNDNLEFEKREINVVDRVKGNTPKGKRYIPLTNEALRILKKAKEINPDGEYVFMPFGRLMITDTFNEYLRRYCNAANVPYFSSHKIRFTSCSLLYNGDNLTQVSSLMGHSQVSTTLHYLRDVTNGVDAMLEPMENAFSVTAPSICTKKNTQKIAQP